MSPDGILPEVLQRRASDPLVSSWVGASAGSGKTKVLIDRMLRLLLEGVVPDRILAITFTNAAAAEMSNRLNATLAEWAIMEPRALDESLDRLQGQGGHDSAMRERARQLFTRIIDSATGVRIHTIHGFCQSVLRRFPIEAGLSPHFALLDERSSDELLRSVVVSVLEEAQAKPAGELAQAIGRISVFFAEARFDELIDEIIAQRSRYQRLFEHHGSLPRIGARIRQLLGVEEGEDSDALRVAACRDGTLQGELLRRAGNAMQRLGTEKTDQPRGTKILAWLSLDARARRSLFDDYCASFLTGEGEPRADIMTRKLAGRHPELGDALRAEAQRLHAVRDRCRAVDLARSSEDLLFLAKIILDSYAARKASAAQVDYEDLILRTRELLREDQDAAWVHYKLDGGIDHVLLDESQDTNPDQWELIRALVQEFFAGEGAVDRARTLFAVGDAKQSIFSFQRADPALFAGMRELFAQRILAAKKEWRPVDLDISFRSVAPVLELVDKVFEPRAVHAGVSDSPPRHQCRRVGEGGLVELWPLAQRPDKGERDLWSVPSPQGSGSDPALSTATRMAGAIREWLDGGEILASQGRPVRAGDIMVLVRNRSAFVPALVRALKQAGVPVAGADRMVLTRELAVADLLAFAQVLLLAEDDMSLAILLRSPLVGLGEDQLFALAHERADTLWSSVEESIDPDVVRTAHWLRHWRGRTDFIAPHELFAGVLNTSCPADPDGSGRRAFAARLGSEALDPLDEFLSASLAYEAQHAPSLQGFLGWMAARPVEIKREPRKAGKDGQGEVTIMTVHGSKGLQSPIVFLADAGSGPGSRKGPHVLWHAASRGEPDFPLWASCRRLENGQCDALRGVLKQREEEEYRRLLYVAMTRAQDRLYVVGWEGGRRVADGCWHRLIEPAMVAIGATHREDGTYRLLQPQTAKVQRKGETRKPEQATVTVPHYARTGPSPEARPVRPLAPSQIVLDEPPALSPLEEGDQLRRFERGRLIHRLLQTLPDLPPDLREAAAERYLKAASNLTMDARAALYGEVATVLIHPEFGGVFGPGSEAEVPVVGLVRQSGTPYVLSGQIDRLVVTAAEVLLIDFKSNRPPPEDALSVPPAYLAQMAAYRSALTLIYPGRVIRPAILWTNEPRLMEIPPQFIDNYLLNEKQLP